MRKMMIKKRIDALSPARKQNSKTVMAPANIRSPEADI